MKTIFLRAIDDDNKAEALLEIIKRPQTASSGQQRFDVDPSTFSSVPRSPFAYWISEPLRQIFRSHPSFQYADREVCSGPDTGQDFRCIRLWWELPASEIGVDCKWVLHAKGGAYNPYYSDLSLVLLWGVQGRELKSIGSANIRNSSAYYRPGLTWPLRTQSGLSVRALPANSIFGHKGPAALVSSNNEDDILSLLALMNTKIFRALVELQLAAADAAARSYEVGVLQRTPIPSNLSSKVSALASLARQAWSLKRALDMTNETSHAFALPKKLLSRITQVGAVEIGQNFSSVQEKIENIAFELYGFKDEDKERLEAWISGNSIKEKQDPNADDLNEEVETESDGDDAAGLLSWAVGVAFGRFDISVATGARWIEAESGPLDPLPSRSPGMIPPQSEPFMGGGGIFVDDPGHRDDLTARVMAVYDTIGEVTEGPEALRAYLANRFFLSHLNSYSKSRRRAPIYWQFATSSSTYSIWVSVHAFNKSTMLQVQNDYLLPKLAYELRRLNDLIASSEALPEARPNGEIESQREFVEELQGLLDELRRAAPLWSPDLNDGILITFAPFWRMIPNIPSWQREVRTIWNELVNGEHDWSHAAMHLWPERVVPKCAADRSIAVSHQLDDNFWFEDIAGKWKPYETPKRSVETIIQERTTKAVKAALVNVIEAPDVTRSAKRSRKLK